MFPETEPKGLRPMCLARAFLISVSSRIGALFTWEWRSCSPLTMFWVKTKRVFMKKILNWAHFLTAVELKAKIVNGSERRKLDSIQPGKNLIRFRYCAREPHHGGSTREGQRFRYQTYAETLLWSMPWKVFNEWKVMVCRNLDRCAPSNVQEVYCLITYISNIWKFRLPCNTIWMDVR